MMTILLGNFSKETVQPISRYQQKESRRELAQKLILHSQEAGFLTMHALARAAKTSIATISALEHGRATNKLATVHTLHKIAAAFSRALVINIDGEEEYFPTETTVEELHAAGAKIFFSCEG